MAVVAVAYSGGRDSTALLHATLAAAEGRDCRVVALHIHHGLNAGADDWLAHCAEECRRWAAEGRPVDFDFHRLESAPAPGESVEAWARAARYAALARLARARGIDTVLLGHHRRDQAETLLLQALRGGGLAGLAGMPARAERDGIVWLRPWLRRSRGEIDAYVDRHGLRFIDDDSNADPRHARNRLRQAVWPALEAAFPQAESTLATAAAWAQEAHAALAELAAIDLAAVTDTETGRLDVERWRGLSPARRSLVLRAWVFAVTGAAASASLVVRLQGELPRSAAARWPVAGGQLVVWRGGLTFTPAPPAAFERVPEPSICLRRAGDHWLPGWGGTLRVEHVRAGGMGFDAPVRFELRRRLGGEQFQAGPARPPRSLKKQFQAAGLPVADRTGPLVFRRGQLVFVPGLGLDARVVEPAGRPAVTLAWLPAGCGRDGGDG